MNKKSKITVWEDIRMSWNEAYGTKVKPERDEENESLICPDYTKSTL